MAGVFLSLRETFPVATSIIGIFDIEFEHFTETIQTLLEAENFEELNAHFQKGLPFYKEPLAQNKTLDTLFVTLMEKSGRTDTDLRKALQLASLMEQTGSFPIWAMIAQAICKYDLQQADEVDALIDQMIAHDLSENNGTDYREELLGRQNSYGTADTIKLLSALTELITKYEDKAKGTALAPQTSIPFPMDKV